ncbi:MAG TPA: HNH endonuclease signature motif containing protein [Gemmataceae bacterium]|nr:HNH endonuclease signature motif containing protein [Gemmataceae bacterium]
MNPHYPLVAERARHRCEYCHAPEAIFNFPFEVEHIVPPGLGGLDDASNWALACRCCNLFKSDHREGTDPESQANVRLFHPRSDDWSGHFDLLLDTGEITGRTPVGRATIARLQMNSAAQLSARQHWIRLGLFG